MPPAKIQTLIVDDEALARQVLTDYVGKLPQLELVGECPDAIQTLAFLQQQSVDLLLLDIQMPELNGLELLASLNHPPRVILTTAYSNFALESYEYGVVDYLLKPISFARFLKAINRLTDAHPTHASTPSPSLDYLEIKHDGLPLQLPINQLLFVKSFGNYLRLVTANKVYTILETLTRMEERLPNAFQRVHKSYIVNTNMVSGVSTNRIKIGSREIPLSPMYKLMLQEKLK